ncbi:hypothetical protein [Streptomyces acidiscabies]|uniref:hypothetical protein n=1 Tax=Streptomyces acidiscabies TaxID=42234 RepID=UPI00073EC5DA|nr:hypothetical protein [Streptomyces acidiscabies]GAQ52102.1 hypothetical protein a10_01883 [Streptomyces acidiscabies]
MTDPTTPPTDRAADESHHQCLDTLAALGIATHRLGLIRDAARLHQQQLIGSSELYAVIEADGPTGQTPTADQAALRDRIAEALARLDVEKWDAEIPPDHPFQRIYSMQADAVLAVLPEPADRAAVLDEAADRIDRTDLPEDYVDMFDNGAKWVTAELRRMAAETRNSAPGTTQCGPVPGQCDAGTGEPCANHEREQAHAEGEHCFCGPECGKGCTCGVAGDAFVPLGHYADCPQATPAPAETRTADTQNGETPDTLPAWLRRRFSARTGAWEGIGDSERSYWEHQARAVRRAVARGGFKTAEAREADRG